MIWAAGLSVFLACLFCTEMFWRSRGHRPSVVDSPALWSLNRARVSDDQPAHVVLLGASRIQLGFSTDTFRQQFPHCRLTQLAVDGSSPLASLASLAEDPHFRGTVICSLTAEWVWPEFPRTQQQYVTDFQLQHSPVRAVETTMQSGLQERLVSINPQVRLVRVAFHALTRRTLPEPGYLITRSDRSRLADYSMVQPSNLAGHSTAAAIPSDVSCLPTPGEWLHAFEVVEENVRQIHARGGRVVFVRFPTANHVWDRDERLFPRRDYWDRMAAVTAAETVHFADEPALNRYQLPDSSHLDAADAPRFTTALLETLAARGILSRRVLRTARRDNIRASTKMAGRKFSAPVPRQPAAAASPRRSLQ